MGVFDYCEFNGAIRLNQLCGSFEIQLRQIFLRLIFHTFGWVSQICVGEMFLNSLQITLNDIINIMKLLQWCFANFH